MVVTRTPHPTAFPAGIIILSRSLNDTAPTDTAPTDDKDATPSRNSGWHMKMLSHSNDFSPMRPNIGEVKRLHPSVV